MPEFQSNYPSPDIGPSRPGEPQLQPQAPRPVLRKPWLHLIVFSILNALLFMAELAAVDMALSLSLSALIFFAGLFPAIHIGLLILNVLLAAFGFSFIYRKREVAIPETAIAAVIGVFACGSLVLPGYIAQMQEKVANPIRTGTDQFDFSGDWNGQQNYWDIRPGYIAYLEQTSQNESSVHLKRVPMAE